MRAIDEQIGTNSSNDISRDEQLREFVRKDRQIYSRLSTETNQMQGRVDRSQEDPEE